ncbi:MAG: tetratricopeptide repeat protein [Gammaproteobacteria bacterium]|nr:tetratricopeptide repeat protein [Gammaproteobacteria bacterium]
MKRLLIIILASLPLAASAAEMQDFGRIDFPTSGKPAAQKHFLQGVAILHSFGWKQARLEFQKAQELDPDFAMAYWGESLCYNHPLISEWDPESPKVVLGKLGATPKERVARAKTEKEKGFIRAVDALFLGEGDTMARRTAYMNGMKSMYERWPDDDEVAAHYALSLLMAAGPAGEGHRMNVLAGAIAMEVTRRNPRHPGAVHYTIHAFDDPVHAPIALPAAQVFDDIAPAVSHARHMPTHIFIQHGMWQQVSASNQSAYDAAVALWEPGDNASDMAHALDWGQYGDLQLGDYERARMWIGRMEKIHEENADQPRILEALPRVKARFIIETKQWKLQPITDESTGDELLATGLSAVHLGDFKTARKAKKRLDALAAAAETGDRSYYARTGQPLQIMSLEVAAMLAIAKNEDFARAEELLQEGVAIAESMRPPNGAANPLQPVHELLGEVLFKAGRYEAAADMYSRSLARTPNRPYSLLGLARSYAALGDDDGARQQYEKLAEVWKNHEPPLLAEVNEYLAALE